MKKTITTILIMLFIYSQVCWAVEKGPFSASEKLSRSELRSLNYAKEQIKVDKEEAAMRGKIEEARRNFSLDKANKNVQKNIFSVIKDRLKDKNAIQAEADKLKELASRAAIATAQKSTPAEVEPLEGAEVQNAEEPAMQPPDYTHDQDIVEIKEEDGTIIIKEGNGSERRYAYNEESGSYLLIASKEIIVYEAAPGLVQEINTYDINIEDGIVRGYAQNIVEKGTQPDGEQFIIETTIVRSDIKYDIMGRIVSYKDVIKHEFMPDYTTESVVDAISYDEQGRLSSYREVRKDYSNDSNDGNLNLTTTIVRTFINYDGGIAAYARIEIDLFGGDVQIELNEKTNYDNSYNKTGSSQEAVVKVKDDDKEVIINVSSSKRGIDDAISAYSQADTKHDGVDSDVIEELDRLIEFIFESIREREKEDLKPEHKTDIVSVATLDINPIVSNEETGEPKDVKNPAPVPAQDLYLSSYRIDLNYNAVYEISREQVSRNIAKKILESLLYLASKGGVNKNISAVNVSGIIKKGALVIDIVTLPQKINIEQLIKAFIHLEYRLNSLRNEYEITPALVLSAEQLNRGRSLDKVMHILSQEALNMRVQQRKEKINAEDAAALKNRIINGAGVSDVLTLSALAVKIDAIVTNFNREAAEALGNGEGAAIVEGGPQNNTAVVISLPSENLPKTTE